MYSLKSIIDFFWYIKHSNQGVTKFYFVFFTEIGVTGVVRIDANGDRNADYSLLDMNPVTGDFEVSNGVEIYLQSKVFRCFELIINSILYIKILT